MTLQREFVVRYRSTGHVRFQVPVQVCNPHMSVLLTEGINAIPGVYTARLFKKQGKLSIRFDESVCDFKALTSQLAALVTSLEQGGEWLKKSPPLERSPKVLTHVGNKVKNLKASLWIKDKYSDAKETMQAAKIVTKLGMKGRKKLIQNPEKAIIDFLNDVLVLYLIKLHWKRVIQLWIPNPLKYRYEWLTVFYLFYLLIRSRRPPQ